MIHSTAIVDPGAQIAADVTIGAYSIIEADVEIGAGCWIGSHVVLKGPLKLGTNNQVFQFACLGEAPQDKKYAGEPTQLVVGSGNVFREYCTVNRGTPGGGGVTRIGDQNLLMAYVHVAHDCQIGNHTIFSNAASLAGHVEIDDWVILGGFTLVHQFCKVGAHCFTGMGSAIAKDVPPYLLIAGQPAAPHGVNKEGLKRRGFSAQGINAVKQAYRLLYRSGLKLETAKKQIEEMAQQHPEIGAFVEFFKRSQRGIVR